jgi:zinc D-Ala-D-Ala carboxypeptidase|tara:strand:- start:93 stop:554 length:462 start_codon:yes stop_codon:yes gene_type:complete
MERISEHVSYKEGVRSNTATRLDIDNTPDGYAEANMAAIAYNIFEPLRKWVGGPIKINSFFRSKKLNQAIGGSSRSQHCQGRAMDLDDTFGHKTNAEMFNYIADNLNYDQIIWEFGDDENPDWVHVSYVSEDENRGRALRAYKEKGKTKYLML